MPIERFRERESNECKMPDAKPTTDTAPTQDGLSYPCGADAPAYRLAFQVWMVVFLLILCISLAVFLRQQLMKMGI